MLLFTSCVAENADFICQAVVDYVGERLGCQTRFVNDIHWAERERQLVAGHIQVGWLCGLPYTWHVDQPEPGLQLLAAPVLRNGRYANQPIYFSDVIVRQDSPYHTFADLRGCAWAYNEPRSYSGYYLVRSHLATLGEIAGYFGPLLESGAHQQSLQLVLDGAVAATALDSTMLDFALAQTPTLQNQIRIIDTLGPSPIPPWVMPRSTPPDLVDALQTVLIGMAEDPAGQVILQQTPLLRFARVNNQDYDPIRRVARLAATAVLSTNDS